MRHPTTIVEQNSEVRTDGGAENESEVVSQTPHLTVEVDE